VAENIDSVKKNIIDGKYIHFSIVTTEVAGVSVDFVI